MESSDNRHLFLERRFELICVWSLAYGRCYIAFFQYMQVGTTVIRSTLD